MGNYGVSEVGTVAGGLVNGAGLASGLLQGRERVRVETSVHNEFVKVGGFAENDKEVW